MRSKLTVALERHHDLLVPWRAAAAAALIPIALSQPKDPLFGVIRGNSKIGSNVPVPERPDTLHRHSPTQCTKPAVGTSEVLAGQRAVLPAATSPLPNFERRVIA